MVTVPMNQRLHPYLRERCAHGTPDFPVGFYPCQVPRDFHKLAFHWHEELEFTLVCQGRLSYSIDFTPLEAQAGDLLLIGPDTLHAAQQLPNQQAATDSVVVHLSLAGLDWADACDQRFLQPLRHGQLKLPPVVRPDSPFYEGLHSCFLRLWACRDEQVPYRELLFRTELLRLVHLLWQCSGCRAHPPAPRAPHPYEEKLKLVLGYMQAHYAEPITVQQLADLCGFSQVHFMNIFKSAFGSTCMDYLIHYRMALAAIDLQETNHSVMQIALDNGFQNISYFNRTFKRYYHLTPTQYRRTRRPCPSPQKP